MSGLDPVGRHDVRQLILRLREEGRTVLFSSHVLSDAELLCSRVAILAKGRLVASGLVYELRARQSGRAGWEIVVSDLAEATVAAVRARVRQITLIADARYAIEVGADARPEPLVAELAAAGARLISVAPLGASLEDVFLRATQAS